MKYTEALIEEINGREPNFLETAKRGYICPVCGNGSGNTGDGITKIPRSNKYFCFKCQAEGSRPDNDVIDLYGLKYNITSFPEKVKQAAAYFGIDPERYQEEPQRKPRKKREPGTAAADQITDADKKAAAEYILKAYENNNFEYLKRRGISEEIQKRFYIGYDPEWIHPKVEREQVQGRGYDKVLFSSPRCIIPRNQYSYLARDTREEIPEDKKAYSKQKINGSGLYYPHAIRSGGTFFIVEGEIDCLSVYEGGGHGVGLGSCANRDLFIDYLQKHPEKTEGTKFILMLDNDETGQKTQQYLFERLQAAGFPVLSADYPAEDPNSFLMKDRKAFINTISFLQAQADSQEAEAKAAELDGKTKTGDLLDYFRNIEKQPYGIEVKTGFNALDAITTNFYGGLHEGLYILGAMSSAGKTTFCLQLAEQIAERGQDVIFFSMEQSKLELMGKLISRHTFTKHRARREDGHYIARTTQEVLNNRRYNTYGYKTVAAIKDAVEELKDAGEYLYIYEGKYNGEKMSMKHVKTIVEQHIQETGNQPVIFIDYLQLLEPDNAKYTDPVKIIDNNIDDLKQLSRLKKIPVIAISSYNRDSYTKKAGADLGAFRGSGMIEYSADVLLALQPHYLYYEKSRPGETEQEKHARIQNYKKEEEKYYNVLGERPTAPADTPARVDLRCMKNRNGKKFTVGFNFIPAFNYYEQRYGDLETWGVSEEEAEEMLNDMHNKTENKRSWKTV